MLRSIKNSNLKSILFLKKNVIQGIKSSKCNTNINSPKQSSSLLSVDRYKFVDTIYNYISAGLLLSIILVVNNETQSDNSIPSSPSSRNDKLRTYRRKEIELHNTKEKKIWVTYNNGVYDVTNFIANHPGGEEKLMLAAGKDLSSLWKLLPFKFHFQSPLAFELLEENRIGNVHPDDVIVIKPSDMEIYQQKYSNRHIYDCIIIGSGISGLQTAHSLINDHDIATEDVLILEAQDYVGGRVRQMTDFIKGCKIDVGAEFLHGSNTLLTQFAQKNNEPLKELFCWAHGDGGPLQESVGKGYGLYYIADKTGKSNRLLRYDDKDKDFIAMNEALWELAELDENKFPDSLSFYDYLKDKGFSDEMMAMASGGFANTLCTNSRVNFYLRSLKQAKIEELVMMFLLKPERA